MDNKSMSSAELADAFAHWAHVRGAATLDGDTALARRAADRMATLDESFRTRGLAARILLTPLLEDQDEAIRYYAAQQLLSIVPARARDVIEAVASGVGPVAADARMGLAEIDSGRFVPD